MARCSDLLSSSYPSCALSQHAGHPCPTPAPCPPATHSSFELHDLQGLHVPGTQLRLSNHRSQHTPDNTPQDHGPCCLHSKVHKDMFEAVQLEAADTTVWCSRPTMIRNPNTANNPSNPAALS